MLPLSINIDGHNCPIRPTPDAGKRDCPIAEVFAPHGMVFSGGESSLVIHSEADLDEVAREQFMPEHGDPEEIDFNIMSMCMAARDMLPPGHGYDTIHWVWASQGSALT